MDEIISLNHMGYGLLSQMKLLDENARKSGTLGPRHKTVHYKMVLDIRRFIFLDPSSNVVKNWCISE